MSIDGIRWRVTKTKRVVIRPLHPDLIGSPTYPREETTETRVLQFKSGGDWRDVPEEVTEIDERPKRPNLDQEVVDRITKALRERNPGTEPSP